MIATLKHSAQVCWEAANACVRMLEEYRFKQTTLRPEFFKQTLIDEPEEYECFPTEPSGVATAVLQCTNRLAQSMTHRTNDSPEFGLAVLKHLGEILNPEVDKSRYAQL